MIIPPCTPQPITRLISELKTSIECILIPSNSSLDRDRPPNIATQLGIDDNPADKYRDTKTGLEIVRYRAEDIPAQCAYLSSKGIPSFGITGRDLLEEFLLETASTPLEILAQLSVPGPLPGQRYRYPTLCLIAPEGASLASCTPSARIVANKKYARLARRFLDGLGQRAGAAMQQPRYLSGKIENEVGCGADFGIDIVFSGLTLRYVDKRSRIPRIPRLRVIEEILESPLVGILPQGYAARFLEMRRPQTDAQPYATQPYEPQSGETQTYKSPERSVGAVWR